MFNIVFYPTLPDSDSTPIHYTLLHSTLLYSTLLHSIPFAIHRPLPTARCSPPTAQLCSLVAKEAAAAIKNKGSASIAVAGGSLLDSLSNLTQHKEVRKHEIVGGPVGQISS